MIHEPSCLARPTHTKTVPEPTEVLEPTETSEPGEPTTTTTEVAVTDDVAGTTTDGDGIGLVVVIGLCLLVAVLAGLIGWLLGSRRSAPAPAQASQVRSVPPAPEVVPPAPVPTERVHAEVVDPSRKKLVDGIISVRDLIDNPAVSERLGQLLESVGVTTLNPTGVRFDPSEHQAQSPPTLVSDPSLDGTIAEVISLGYSERGSITRFPVVIINRYSDSVE